MMETLIKAILLLLFLAAIVAGPTYLLTLGLVSVIGVVTFTQCYVVTLIGCIIHIILIILTD